MRTRTKVAATGALALGLAAAGAGVVVAAGGDDDEAPITGEALEKATAAALAHTGGGAVTDTEVGDEESLYEVEVTLPDGSRVDVQLDEGFRVVGTTPDDGPDDD